MELSCISTLGSGIVEVCKAKFIYEFKDHFRSYAKGKTVQRSCKASQKGARKKHYENEVGH